MNNQSFSYGYKNVRVSPDFSLNGKSSIEPMFYIDGKIEQVTLSISPKKLRAMANNLLKMADLIEESAKKSSK